MKHPYPITEAISNLVNLPGALFHFIQQTAHKHKADIILVDLPPSLSAITQNLVLSSTLIILPVFPDLFSNLAVESLGRIFPRWLTWLKNIQNNEYFKDADYKMPNITPRFGGLLFQKFRTYKGDPAKGYNQWMTQISRTTDTALRNAMKEAFTLTGNELELAKVPDFNTLGTIAQLHNAKNIRVVPPLPTSPCSEMPQQHQLFAPLSASLAEWYVGCTHVRIRFCCEKPKEHKHVCR